MAEVQAVKMIQLRFYGLGNSKNFPADIGDSAEENLWVSNILQNFPNVIKLGIQTLPGVCFSFGQNMTDPASGIIVDHTGIYELDLRDVSAQIGALSFAPESLSLIGSIDTASIIVDIAYLEEQG